MVNATLIQCALLSLTAPAPAPSPAPEPLAAPAPAAAVAEAAPDEAAVPDAAAPEAAAEPPEAELTAQPEPPEATPVEATAGGDEPKASSEPAPDPYQDVAFDIGVFPTASINGKYKDKKIRNNVSLGLFWNQAALVEGMTVSMGVTIVEEQADGLSLALVGNINRGRSNGIQSAVGFNVAEEVHGIQGALGFNRAEQVKGAQFAMVNAAGTVRGAQFGLINIADEADASFALIPYTKKGGVHPEVFSSDTAMLNVGIRLPAKYTYMFGALGVHPLGMQSDGRLTNDGGTGRGWEAGLGFGAHVPVAKRWGVDIDLSSYVVSNSLQWDTTPAGMAKLRLMASFEIAKRFTLYGGPTLNTLVHDSSDDIERPGYRWVSADYSNSDVRVRMWPGFVLGARF